MYVIQDTNMVQDFTNWLISSVKLATCNLPLSLIVKSLCLSGSLSGSWLMVEHCEWVSLKSSTESCTDISSWPYSMSKLGLFAYTYTHIAKARVNHRHAHTHTTRQHTQPDNTHNPYTNTCRHINFQKVGDSYDKPTTVWSRSMAISQCWTTLSKRTRSLSAPDINSTGNNEPWKKPVTIGVSHAPQCDDVMTSTQCPILLGS